MFGVHSSPPRNLRFFVVGRQRKRLLAVLTSSRVWPVKMKTGSPIEMGCLFQRHHIVESESAKMRGIAARANRHAIVRSETDFADPHCIVFPPQPQCLPFTIVAAQPKPVPRMLCAPAFALSLKPSVPDYLPCVKRRCHGHGRPARWLRRAPACSHNIRRQCARRLSHSASHNPPSRQASCRTRAEYLWATRRSA